MTTIHMQMLALFAGLFALFCYEPNPGTGAFALFGLIKYTAWEFDR